jgi:hypothetical protein
MKAAYRATRAGESRRAGNAPFRTPGQSRVSPEVRVSYVCPVCAGPHPRAKCTERPMKK